MSQRKQGTGIWVLPAVLVLAMPWLGLRVTPGHWSTAVGWCAANMVLTPLMAFALIALEQTAMFVTAEVLGDHVLTVALGVGPTLWARQFAMRKVEVRLVPVGWMNTIITTRSRGQRLRTTVATVAGLLVSAAPFVVWLAVFDSHGGGRNVAASSRLAPDVLAVYLSFLIGGMTAVFVLGVLGGSKITAAQLKARRVLGITLECSRHLTRGAYDEAVMWARRGLDESPDDALLQISLASALSIRGDAEAFALTESLVKRELVPGMRALALDVRAWECYLRHDDALRAEADEASKEAVTINPTSEGFLNTRGHVALWHGRLNEAEVSLTRAYTVKNAAGTRAFAAAGLAMVCARTNRPDEAAEWLGRARSHGHHHPVIARAIAEVDPLHRL